MPVGTTGPTGHGGLTTQSGMGFKVALILSHGRSEGPAVVPQFATDSRRWSAITARGEKAGTFVPNVANKEVRLGASWGWWAGNPLRRSGGSRDPRLGPIGGM